ncbi:MAG: iron-containing alcohol dehydrogenase [Erysipelotrichaceae bacterium]|jgi:alcohol dehydrogenase YqhD (iron-dependent ADH family)|nr:iron-containing alcohol dehydrogenase [Erysipelotrichaceae bacterium]
MIDNFTFNLNTKLYFGKDEENNIGKILKENNAKRILLVYGQGSVKRSGLLDRVIKCIELENIVVIEYGNIRPNPTVESVIIGIDLCKEYNIDYIVAVGGGSAMDAAKLIATGFYYDGNPFDISLKKYIPKKALPLGVIVTIAASGSEMSTSCVIQDDLTGIKRGYNSEFNRPIFAIENPELTYSVPKNQTGYGIVDILMHTLERYFSHSVSENEPADAFSEVLLKETLKSGLIVYNNPFDYESRANLLLLSSFSHNGLTSIGKNYSMPVHQMEHVLSGLYPSVAHGAGLAALFPTWARYYIDYDLDKFDRFARNVFGSYLSNKKENAKIGIDKLVEYFKMLGMPLSFKELGINNPDIEKMVDLLSENKTRTIKHHKKDLSLEAMKIIYSSLMSEGENK